MRGVDGFGGVGVAEWGLVLWAGAGGESGGESLVADHSCYIVDELFGLAGIGVLGTDLGEFGAEEGVG